jgi:hypothetical protein
MDYPLTDPHAEQPHRRQLTCWVLDRAVQDAGLTEGGDQLGRAALELFKRVIPDLIVSEMKKALLSATAARTPIGRGVTAPYDPRLCTVEPRSTFVTPLYAVMKNA